MSNKENALCFFSGTGNSFDIALRLSTELGNTDLFNIATFQKTTELVEYKRIGLIFPVYGFTLPNIVSNFISKLTNKNIYYFVVVTMGAFALGAGYRTKEVFDNAGVALKYFTNIYMPENYILFSKVPSDKLIKKHLENSKKRISTISQDVLSEISKPIKKPITYYMTQKTSQNETAKWKNTAKSFTVSDSCTKCGKCVRLCPVNNIAIAESKIIFNDHCECCLACMHACPQKAINQGERTAGKKRYVNPNVNLESMKNY